MQVSLNMSEYQLSPAPHPPNMAQSCYTALASLHVLLSASICSPKALVLVHLQLLCTLKKALLERQVLD